MCLPSPLSCAQLDLSYNNLGPEGAKAIAALCAVCASVTKILVSSNRLGAEGATILCDALRESKVTNVQELDLSDNNIGRDGAKAIAALCSVTASVTKILVRRNKLGDQGATVLCDALRASKVTNVQELDLSYNGIGPEGAKAVAAMAAVVASVTKVLVSGNRLGDAGTTILCDALRESTVTKVQELDLGSNLIGPEGAKAVAAMAAVVASVTSVWTPAHQP